MSVLKKHLNLVWSYSEFIVIAIIIFHPFLACVALAFPWSFGAKSEERESIFRAAKTENPVPQSLFALKPNGNACYAG